MAIINNGFNTTLNVAGAGTAFTEVEVTPPALVGGGPIDISGMRNRRWRTKTPKYLVDMDKIAVKVRYDPGLYTPNAAAGAGLAVSMRNLINLNTLYSIIFPVLTTSPPRTLTIPAYIDSFKPDGLKVDEAPTADLEMYPTMQINGTETDPVVI